jgi:lipopolysaccharide export system permease protein
MTYFYGLIALNLKKLDKLLLKSFLGPFFVTFFITLFVLVMQFFWKYVDELVGKGIEIPVLLQLIFYMSATLVPVALPLGILLASIMTFGNLGETYELVALKSAGISLNRFMRPIFSFILVISAFAFYFNNWVIPVANIKAFSLLHDLRQMKPTFSLREGVFFGELTGYTIRVERKDKDGQGIHGVMIYDHTRGRGNDRVILAKDGKMYTTPDKKAIVFELEKGWQYEEKEPQGIDKREQVRMYFDYWKRVIDASEFGLNRVDEKLYESNYGMMNVQQLNHQIDTIRLRMKGLPEKVSDFIKPEYTFISWKGDSAWKALPPARKYDTDFYARIPDSTKTYVLTGAENSIRNSKTLLNIAASDEKLTQQNLVLHQVEWHRKFALSFACIVLFLIGAPLGAIIRKGGLGLPLVFAVAFFVVYYVASMIGEKMAKQEALDPFSGMWLSTFVLLPIAVFLVNRARTDAAIMNKDWYVKFFNKIKKRFTKELPK